MGECLFIGVQVLSHILGAKPDVLGYDRKKIPPAPSLYKASTDALIGMAKVLPIIDVLGYDGQNSSFSSSSSSSSSSSPPSRSDLTPITQEGSHM